MALGEGENLGSESHRGPMCGSSAVFLFEFLKVEKKSSHLDFVQRGMLSFLK